MDADSPTWTFPALRRLPTRVPGLDTVLGGGLMAGDAYLVTGKPGTGKTTLGNQLAFAHVAAGGTALFATLLTESHDRMLAHLNGLSFVDPAAVGDRIHYISLLGALQEGSFEGMLRTLVATMRNYGPTLLVVDGTGVTRMFAGSDFDYLQFIHALQARTALFGCTTVFLAGKRDAKGAAAHVDGVIQLANTAVNQGDARWVRVAKLRGSTYLHGHHGFAIGDDGIVVLPRLEAAHANLQPEWHEPGERLAFGIASLDAMVAGGLTVGSSTLVLGTPGAGKTVLGLHFLTEGAHLGEPGLLASFQETTPGIVSTADGIGLDLGRHLDSGLVRMMWRPPLEFEPDEWAWHLLAAVDAHQPRRLVVDAFSDLFRLFVDPERQTHFAHALANGLRERGVTTLFLMEIDAFAGPALTVPVPNLSATMDNGLLLRTVELHSALHRMVAILKLRQSGFDPNIREFTIGSEGIVVGEPFNATELLTGSAVPPPEPQ